MGRTFTEKAGMINAALAAAKDPIVHTRLVAKKLEVDPLIEGLEQELARVNALGAEQERMRMAFQATRDHAAL